MGLNRPKTIDYPQIVEENPLQMYMSVIYTISENKIIESKANFKFDKSKSYIMSPSFLV